MFNVQSAFFDKYGSPILGIECSATAVQVVGIGTNVVVTISAVEAGRLIRCDMVMSVPGGTETLTVNQVTVPSGGGTLTFMGNIVDLVDRRGAGNYSISNIKLFDENTGTNLYSGNPGGGGYCTSMNIGNGGGSQGTVLVTISPTATVAVGANKTIIPTCKNHNTGATVSCPSLIWDTGDSDILTVSSSGVIRGVSEGTTWVHVTENVDYPILNDNDTCEVTITSGGNMSCTIQDYGWKKNGNWVDSNCRATTTDTIAMQAIIYFDQAYSNQLLWFSIKNPDNTIDWYRYGYTAPAAGTYIWDVTVGQLPKGPGTYYINEVDITDINGGILCQATGTPDYCRSLNVVAGGGGTSYDCINRNCLLRQDTQGFFSDYSTCNRVCEVKSVDFQVVGNGQMYIEVNNAYVTTVLPGESKPVTLRKGNQLGIILTAYLGNHLVNLCDVPQTDCQTALSYYLDILDANALPQKMVATFASSTAQGYNCSNCNQLITGGQYPTSAQCVTACTVTPTKYNCVSGACQGPFVTGQYNSLAECQVACTITQKWKCINPATNTCVQAADGTFNTEALCKASTSCQPSGEQSWYCNTVTKICSLQTGSGGYATKAACDAACSGNGGDIDPCDKCTSDQYCLFGQCIKKNDAYMAIGAGILLMVLTKK